MLISDIAIKRPVVTIVTMLALVVFGVVALTQLDTDEFPDVQQPVVAVAVPYPGASPDTVEREVINPIEEAISGISGVDQVMSNSLDSFGNIIVIFVFQKDVQQATQEIRDAISGIRNRLPPEMEEPILRRFDPANMPIMQMTLSSPALSNAELTRMVDPGITKDLRSIQGVAQVNVVGGIERELTVEINPQAMRTAGVSVAQIVQALQAQNLAAPVGRLEGDLTERTIRLRGRMTTPSEFAQLVVSESAGRLVRLGEVATVRDGTEEPRSAAFFNGRPAVGIDEAVEGNKATDRGRGIGRQENLAARRSRGAGEGDVLVDHRPSAARGTRRSASSVLTSTSGASPRHSRHDRSPTPARCSSPSSVSPVAASCAARMVCSPETRPA